VFFTEFANATGWVHAGDKAIAGRLIKTDDEHPLVAQIWGGEPGDMEQFAAHCAQLGFDGIDINRTVNSIKTFFKKSFMLF